MMKRLFTVLALLVFAVPFAHSSAAFAQERIEVAQNKPRTLFDLLFGPKEQAAPERAAPRRSSGGGGSGASAPRASLPPAKPEVEKAENATRLAVFGDSLAIDLAKALERFYAEDPNLAIIDQGVGSSGFVRDDYFDWNKAIDEAIAANSFDIAVIIIGINDRQNLNVDGNSLKPLTDEWKAAYSARLSRALQALRSAAKPVLWVELPPMQAQSYSAAMTQIAALHRLAAFSGGAEYVEAYERFADENGNYVSFGPDLKGVSVQMRKGDGIHFTNAGADKLAFYINQSLKRFYSGGTISIAIADPLADTDVANLARPPFQGLGQIRLLEVAGAVVKLDPSQSRRSGQLLIAEPGQNDKASFPLDQMVKAPMGRADAFGVGVDPNADPGDGDL